MSFDKLAHAFVYLVFAWFYVKMQEGKDQTEVLKQLLILAAFIPVLDELHQIPIPGRMFSIWDIVADLIGFAIVAIYLKIKINRLLPS